MQTLGPMFYSQFKSLLGEGVFNADGTLSPIFTHTSWLIMTEQVKCGSVLHINFILELSTLTQSSRFHRAMTRPFFTRERISDFDIYDKNCASTLQLARTRLAEGYPVEFQVGFSVDNYTPDSQGLLCVGSSCSVHPGLCYRILIWE